jgi:CDP-glucose 4,6-dehydratase
MTPSFWRGKRVFLTGHTGFKGGWLSLWLQALGAEVHGFALAPDTEPNLFTVANVANGMASSTFGDIRDAAVLAQALRACDPEVVIHMAAQPLVRASYDDPVGTYATNVMGTVHLLEAVRGAAGVRAVVNITTDKCYENREWLWGYREDEPMGGHDPYSSSKGCAELVTSAYRRSFLNSGTALASARAGTVIGGGGPGSTCWSRCRVICNWPNGCGTTARPWPKAGTSARPTMTRSRWAGSSSAWPRCGGTGAAGAWMRARNRTRRRC